MQKKNTERQIERVEKSVEKSTKKTIKVTPIDRVHAELDKGAIDGDFAIKMENLINQRGLSYIEAMRELRHISIDIDYSEADKTKTYRYNLKAVFMAKRDCFALTNVSPIGNTVAIVAPMADGTCFIKVYTLAVKPSASSLYKGSYIPLIEKTVTSHVSALKGADYKTIKGAFLALLANGSKDVSMIDTPIKSRELAIDNAMVKGLAKRDSIDKRNAVKVA